MNDYTKINKMEEIRQSIKSIHAQVNAMSDSCQNCGKPIPAHMEAEYCSNCADADYGFMVAG